RLAEEIILWSSSEFNFVRVSVEYVTGSSIMPQKRNPDYVELIRARTGTVYGCLMSVLSICKALPYSYNRDLQEVTPHLLTATNISASSVSVMKSIVEKLELNKEEMAKQAQVGFTTATELADTIVRETGVSFRTAHKLVADLVNEGVALKANRGVSEVLNELDAFSTRAIGKKLSARGLTEKKVTDALNIVSSIEKRNIKGGPAKRELRRMIRARKTNLEKDDKLIGLKGEKVRKSLDDLAKEVKRKARIITVMKR
ncbi:argininosuccinate lyase, partial [Candidatus Methanophagaceae archaeon]